MRPILAIAAITIRSAVRSKVILCLLTILFAIIVGLPLTLKGDGTLEGQVQIILGYTLGLSCAILSMATLWAGCSAIATEIQEKQIQMLVAKPVRRAEIWLGKWTGLMAMNGTLLLLCVAATYGLLRWATQPARLNQADRERLVRDVLVARREVRPPPPDVEEETRARFEQDQKSGKLPPNMDAETAMEALRRNFRALSGAVPPGSARSWEIELPEKIADDSEITVRFKFAVSSVEHNPTAGMWLAGTKAERDIIRIPQTNTPLAFHEFKIPAGALRGGTSLVLSYVNSDDSGLTVLFPDDQSLSLLLPAGGFAANLARGALIVFAQLALLTALGVTAGAMFSLPVAGFISLFAVMMLFSAGFLGELSTTKVFVGTARDTAAWEHIANTALHSVYWTLNQLTQPLDFDSPWGDIATARLVSWARVAKSLLVNALLYGGVTALFGLYVFNRREVALPQN